MSINSEYWFRIHVGLESYIDLINDLKKALNNYEKIINLLYLNHQNLLCNQVCINLINGAYYLQILMNFSKVQSLVGMAAQILKKN